MKLWFLQVEFECKQAEGLVAIFASAFDGKEIWGLFGNYLLSTEHYQSINNKTKTKVNYDMLTEYADAE